MKTALFGDSSTDLNSWSAWVDRTGVAVSVLIALSVLMWRFARFLRPKADSAIEIFLEATRRLPAMIEAQARRDERLQETLEAQNHLIARIVDQNDRMLQQLERKDK